MKSKLPPVVAFVLLFAFGLMLVAFRSLVIAVKAILLNLLSVAAAYGVLLPATMKLLGEWNWYMPRWLRWLPRLEHHEAEVAAESEPAPASVWTPVSRAPGADPKEPRRRSWASPSGRSASRTTRQT